MQAGAPEELVSDPGGTSSVGLRPRRVVFVSRPGSQSAVGTGPAAEILAELGCPVRRVTDEAAAFDPDELVWLAGGPNWYPNATRRLLSAPAESRPVVLLWLAEPLPLPSGAGLPRQRLHAREIAKILLRDARATDQGTNFRCVRRLHRHGLPDLLVVTSQDKQEFLSEHAIAAEVVPFGYYDATHGRDLGLERDIDVLFIGALDVPRRRQLLRRLGARGVRVEAVGSWKDSAFWGENRTRLVNRAKIFLNLSRFPGQFSGARLVLGMANRALVMSEPMYRPAPFVSGTHFVSASIEEMPERIERYLSVEGDRERISGAGHDFVTSELTMQRSVERILALLEGREHGASA